MAEEGSGDFASEGRGHGEVGRNGEPFTGGDDGGEGEDVEESAEERGEPGLRPGVIMAERDRRRRASAREEVIGDGEVVGIGRTKSVVMNIRRSDSSAADSGCKGAGAGASLESVVLLFHGGERGTERERVMERNRDEGLIQGEKKWEEYDSRMANEQREAGVKEPTG